MGDVPPGRGREPGPEQDDQGDRRGQAGQRDGFAGGGGGDAVGLQRAGVHQRAGGRPERGEVADEEGGQDDVRGQPEPDPRPERGQHPPVELGVAAERDRLGRDRRGQEGRASVPQGNQREL